MRLLLTLLLLLIQQTAHADGQLTIAAAADMRFAMDEIVALFGKDHPHNQLNIVYGSSGKFHTQIRQGAPYDVYFSADIAYPRALKKDGYTTGEVQPYARGRIVLWSLLRKVGTLTDLADSDIQRIAIANPVHAPYGMRAKEALEAAGIWDKIEPKLVSGDNIAQTAQFVLTGNADVAIIALSLAKGYDQSDQGNYALIPEKLHHPLEQGFVMTQRAANNPTARDFARFMSDPKVRAIMLRYGFALPGEAG